MKHKELFNICLAPTKNPLEMGAYKEWLHEFNVKILAEGDEIEDALILAGGADIGVQPIRDATEFEFIRKAVEKGVPILGVCRGMQILNHYFGGKVEDITESLVEDHTIETISDGEHTQLNSQFHWIRSMNGDLFICNSRHHQHCSIIAECFTPTHYSIDGLVEAFVGDKILAVQWHPERNEIKGRRDTESVQLPINWLKQQLKNG